LGYKDSFDTVLKIDQNNQQAKDAVAGIEIETPHLSEARILLDDAQHFLSEQSAVLPSISEIATDAANLKIALTNFDEQAAMEAMTRLNDLLSPMSGFQEFRKREQEKRNQEARQRLAEASDKGTKNLACIDNYVRRDIANPKNASLNGLRVQIDAAVKKQDINDLV
jgi:hypothetical protein